MVKTIFILCNGLERVGLCHGRVLGQKIVSSNGRERLLLVHRNEHTTCDPVSLGDYTTPHLLPNTSNSLIVRVVYIRCYSRQNSISSELFDGNSLTIK